MTVAVDITNHLIPYATVKQMLAKAWNEGRLAEADYLDEYEDWRDNISDHMPEPPNNPYQGNK